MTKEAPIENPTELNRHIETRYRALRRVGCGRPFLQMAGCALSDKIGGGALCLSQANSKTGRALRLFSWKMIADDVMVARIAVAERLAVLPILFALGLVGIVMAAAGHGDPLGAHGWLVLLFSLVLFFVVAVFFTYALRRPGPDPCQTMFAVHSAIDCRCCVDLMPRR
ncbi:MAG: hypothetical protein WCD16_05300 [Paracoccaceae bacterium]